MANRLSGPTSRTLFAANGQMIVTLVLLSLAGCATSRATIDDARLAFASGDADSAAQILRKHSNKTSPHVDLDLAVVELAQGDHRAAEARLRGLRDRFDSQSTIAPLRESASLLTDDRARAYRPAGYEQVMLRTLLAICSMAGDGVDAESYSLQAEMKQRELATSAEERGLLANAASGGENLFQPIAFAPYLRGVIRESTHRDYDDATRAYQLVSQVQPDFIPAHEDIARASGASHSKPGHGVLIVIACVGRGPVLAETTAETTSTALSIASSVLNAETNEDDEDEDAEENSVPVLPNIASVKIPTVHLPPSNVVGIGTSVSGQLLGATQTITSVANLARNQTSAEMPWTIARAVVRRATKESVVAATRDQLGITGDFGRLFHFAASSAWAASEKADQRCWGLLPRDIQVLRAELPIGQHVIELAPLGVNGTPCGVPVGRSISIEDGRNRYLIAIAPDQAIYVVDSEE